MTNYKTRIQKAKEKSRIILSNDYSSSGIDLEKKTISNIKMLNPWISGIKINFHLLLPLGKKEIKKIIKTAHNFQIQAIADIKLNDIGNTNEVATSHLWDMGFDAVIVNPIMGLKSLRELIQSSHANEKGVITLCHMSAPSAKLSYELELLSKQNKKSEKLFHLFLKWAIKEKADGVIVGATYPKIIEFCKKQIKTRLDIYSPGIGLQGGNPKKTIKSGSDFLIVGRSILNSKNPKEECKKFFESTILD